MHFIIDNQPPIKAGEEGEMGKILFFRAAVCENLVGADRDGTDIFALARVLPYHLGWDIGLIENFADPLAHGYSIW